MIPALTFAFFMAFLGNAIHLEAILGAFAARFVIVLGASREGLLQQVQQGNIPAVISRQSNCTVILVRAS
ncbi:hypothetical protein [Phormidesmis priestleyi]